MTCGRGRTSSEGACGTANNLPFERDVPRVYRRHVLVMGLGLFGGGVAAVRWLARHGARVTVTDLRSAGELRESLHALQGVDVHYRLGGHDEKDFRRADLVIVSPAVPLNSSWLRLAKRLDTEINLFFKLCRARTVVGVTGTNGKTTTAALTHGVLRRLGRAWLGGNIGRSLLDEVEEIQPDDVVTLELSSFQLETLRFIKRSPTVAVVTNITPNHLDRHGTMENYVQAKRQIVAHQRASPSPCRKGSTFSAFPERAGVGGGGDVKVLNADDPIVSGFDGPAPTLRFGLRSPADVTFDGEAIRLGPYRVDVRGRRLPGEFNLTNMMAAAAASWAARPCPEWAGAAEETFREFRGIEHRLEYVAEVGGVRFYNDSIATNPEATMAALRALPGPVLLILGGSSKGLSFQELARAARNVRFAALFGRTARELDAVLGRVPREIFRDLDEAVLACVSRAVPGDTVLFSPACASFDMFRNFAERGARFKAIVRRLSA